MKKALFISICLFAMGVGVLLETPLQACITPWQGDEVVSKKPSPLHVAIEKGDLAKVKKIVQQGADVNQKQHSVCYGYITNHGSTALARAVSFGHVEIASYLIERGADVINVSDYHEDNRVKIYYLEENAPLVEREDEHEKIGEGAATLFSYALTPEMVHFVARVLKEKDLLTQIVHHENNQEDNAIFYQLQMCNEDMVKTLSSYGMKFPKNSNPLGSAVLANVWDSERHRRVDCPVSFIDFLLAQGFEIKNDQSTQEIFLKALYRYPHLAKKMLDNPNLKIDLNSSFNHLGTRPLDVAIEIKDFDLVSFLIDKGAKSERALLNAVDEGHFPIVKLLVEKGFDVNQTDTSHMENLTPLLMALSENKKDIALFLIEHGANVNVRDKKGKTPLHYKIAYEYPLYEKIIQAGADLEATDMDGNKPYHIAKRYLKAEALKLFESKEGTKKGLPCLGIDFSKKDEKGETPLHTIDDLELAKCFVQKGADVNASNLNGQTPLMTQIIQKKWKIVEYLLRVETINFSHQDNLGNTYLHYYFSSAKGNELPYFSRIDQINVQNKEGKTPLHYAAENGFMREFSNKPSVNFNVKDNLGRTPLFYLNDSGPVLNYFDLSVQDNFGNTALVYIKDLRNFERAYKHLGMRFSKTVNLNNKEALEANRPDKNDVLAKIQFLLSQKDLKGVKALILGMVNSDFKAEYTYTLLDYASYRLHDIFTIFKEIGLDVSVKDKEGKTVLQKMVLAQNGRLLKTLLDMGFDVNLNERDENGETLLHMAMALPASRHSIGPNEMVSLLIKSGADVNIKDKEGNSPLHKALDVQKPDFRLISLLLKNGADANMKDKNGKTPLQKALNLSGSHLLPQLLIKHGARIENDPSQEKTDGGKSTGKSQQQLINQKLIYPTFFVSRDTSRISMLLERGLDVNTKDSRGNSLLHNAVFYQNMPLLKLLIEKGAHLNIKDNKDETPLILAIKLHRLDMVRLLIEKGADINVKDDSGFSFLYHLILSDRMELIDLMLQKGLDVNTKIRNNETLLITAIKFNKFEIVRLLIEKGADVNIKDAYGKTALDYCAQNKNCSENWFSLHKRNTQGADN